MNNRKKRSSFQDKMKQGTWDDPRNRDDEDLKKTLEQCDRILEAIEDADEDLQDKAFDFFEGVTEFIKSVRKTIEASEHVSPKQQTAIDNCESGVNRWIENYHG